MNLVLFASGGLCWRNTQSNRSAGEIVGLIRRFWFPGLVFVFLLVDITGPAAAQSQQPETVTASQAVLNFSTRGALSTTRISGRIDCGRGFGRHCAVGDR
jgi:hypothetical protein